ncbi:MAG: hypothetical protein AABX29_00325 [Nanoarchaeota archaeon]
MAGPGKTEYVVGLKDFFGSEIRKKGILDPKRFHKEIIPWFFENKYIFNETNITNKDTTAGKEQKIIWNAFRKVDDYFKFNIEVELLFWRWRGEKAELNLRFKGWLEKDYMDKFRRRFGPKFGEFMRKIYEMYVINEKIDKMKGKVWVETNDLIDECKKITGSLLR